MENKEFILSEAMIDKRLEALVNQVFKILPMRESNEPSLPIYMKSLQREMLGLQGLVAELQTDAQYITVLSILQYLITNDCDVPTVKTETFKAITLLRQLNKKRRKRK